jgi:phenylacetate-coenzyme A ligase PaaK-like adenylate-forming protein
VGTASDDLQLSVLRPVDEWVERLDAFRPAFLAGYRTALRLLAHEQRRRLDLAIAPSLVWSGGEHMTPAARHEIERALGAVVIDEYGSSECLSIAVGCSHGWLHLNADWVVLEPVDAATARSARNARIRRSSPTWRTACSR